MEPFDEICPLGRTVKFIPANELDGTQKTWLAKQIVDGIQTPHELAAKYGLQPKLLNKYARMLRNEVSLHCSNGRQAIFNAQSRGNIAKEFADAGS